MQHRTCAACATHSSLVRGREKIQSPSALSDMPGARRLEGTRSASGPSACAPPLGGTGAEAAARGAADAAASALPVLASRPDAAGGAGAWGPADALPLLPAGVVIPATPPLLLLLPSTLAAGAAPACAGATSSTSSITINLLAGTAEGAGGPCVGAVPALAAASCGHDRRLCPSWPQYPQRFFRPAADRRRLGLRACASRMAREMLLRHSTEPLPLVGCMRSAALAGDVAGAAHE
jgi:hypothetical protein